MKVSTIGVAFLGLVSQSLAIHSAEAHSAPLQARRPGPPITGPLPQPPKKSFLSARAANQTSGSEASFGYHNCYDNNWSIKTNKTSDGLFSLQAWYTSFCTHHGSNVTLAPLTAVSWPARMESTNGSEFWIDLTYHNKHFLKEQKLYQSTCTNLFAGLLFTCLGEKSGGSWDAFKGGSVMSEDGGSSVTIECYSASCPK
ncbi:hypothetical protein PRK78_001858 [Emydomyces testavorans]|uniref:Uncharacterized protein n=1 Tax=Emydomyces testavorans TaxID=2070801 RepID=A0AAF0DDI0_9EURO|nr:hypothetical protein PRK78_001858 [Emydomyces testavorans]